MLHARQIRHVSSHDVRILPYKEGIMGSIDGNGSNRFARRDFIKLAGAAVGGALTVASPSAQHERPHFTHLTSGLKTRHRHHKHKMSRPPYTACDILTKFVDPLPTMPTIEPRSTLRGVP